MSNFNITTKTDIVILLYDKLFVKANEIKFWLVYFYFY